MGWFDMIRRLEKKVTNGNGSYIFYNLEKRMAQSGGYDLSDPFIDDGNLTSQTTSITVCAFQTLHFRFLNLHLSVFSPITPPKPSRAVPHRRNLFLTPPSAVESVESLNV